MYVQWSFTPRRRSLVVGSFCRDSLRLSVGPTFRPFWQVGKVIDDARWYKKRWFRLDDRQRSRPISPDLKVIVIVDGESRVQSNRPMVESINRGESRSMVDVCDISKTGVFRRDVVYIDRLSAIVSRSKKERLEGRDSHRAKLREQDTDILGRCVLRETAVSVARFGQASNSLGYKDRAFFRYLILGSVCRPAWLRARG